MIDVDHFKPGHNDTYGHPALEGDACLDQARRSAVRAPAAGIQGFCRPLWRRVEFCLLLPNTGPQRARREIGENGARRPCRTSRLPHSHHQPRASRHRQRVGSRLHQARTTPKRPGELIEAAGRRPLRRRALAAAMPWSSTALLPLVGVGPIAGMAWAWAALRSSVERPCSS